MKSLDDIIDLYKSGNHEGNKGPCQGFSGPCENEGTRYRQNTKYGDDDRNFVIMCDACREGNDEHWNDMWADYWSGCL